MFILSGLNKILVKTALITTLLGCTLTVGEKNAKQDIILEKQIIENQFDINRIIENPIKNVIEYDSFIRSKVNEDYSKDVKDVYNFYNIKRDFPRYGFKSKKNQAICFDCIGAVYKENLDSIYFYSSCEKKFFETYLKYFEKSKENMNSYLENIMHYYIKHEAGHAFYYKLGKELGEEYLFNVDNENTSALYNIQHNLIEEGVAEYIAYKGELTNSAKKLNDSDFKKMVENKNDLYLYELGFMLVKPILDKNFEKGIKELIKNPLRKEDLNNLPEYRENRMKNIERGL
jgi:hypothetical protein